MANSQATMTDLDTFNDYVIIFEAVRFSDNQRLPIREPLRPTNTQVLSPLGQKSPSCMDGAADMKSPSSIPQSLAFKPQDENQQQRAFHTSRVPDEGLPLQGDMGSSAVPHQSHGKLGPLRQNSSGPAGLAKNPHPPSGHNIDMGLSAGFRTSEDDRSVAQRATIERQHIQLAGSQYRQHSKFETQKTPEPPSLSSCSPIQDVRSGIFSNDAEFLDWCDYYKAWFARFSEAYPGRSRGIQ